MNVDELIFLMIFLLEGTEEASQSQVVTLVVMHGSQSASSVVLVIHALANDQSAQAYDLDLNKNIHTVYDELKQKIMTIHQGKGILLIYDMGSIHTMAESIAQETKIPIRAVEVPITLVGIAGSNYAAEDATLDEVADYLQDNFSGLQYFRTRSEEEEEPIEESPVLEDQFPQFDMKLMGDYLTMLIRQLEQAMQLTLDEDKQIGLIIHIVCLIDKLKQQNSPSVNFMAYEILGAYGDGRYGDLFEKVKQFLKPLEDAFDVIINDNEIATILSIIIVWIFDMFFRNAMGMNFAEGIITFFQPLFRAADGYIGLAIIFGAMSLFWFVGVHGPSIVEPAEFYKDGDFMNPKTIDAFVEYAKFCFEEYKEDVTYWFTFNEIWAVATNKYIEGTFPYGVKYDIAGAVQLMHNMMVAHAKAVGHIRKPNIKEKSVLFMPWKANIHIMKQHRKILKLQKMKMY